MKKLDTCSYVNDRLNAFDKVETFEFQSEPSSELVFHAVPDSVDSSSLTSSPRLGIRVLNDEDDCSAILNFNKKIPPLVIGLTFLASISGFMFGYDTGYISAALVSLGKDLDNKYLSYGEKEIITAATSLGALITSLFAGTLADIFGRKPVTMSSNVMFLIGAILQACTHSFWQMAAGRLLMGFGIGIGSLLSPLFISEIAPSEYRGRLTVVNSACITGGQLIAYGIGAGTSKIDNGWRILVAISVVPSMIQLVSFYFFPDTPRFYVMSNQRERAKEVLRRTYKTASEGEILAKVEELESSYGGDSRDAGVWRTTRDAVVYLFTTPSCLRALVIACGLQAIQQFCGFNSLMYFSSTIFKTVGFTDATSVSIVVAATNFVFTIVAFFAIDRIGRRNVLFIGLPFMTGALVVCAISFHFLGVKFTGEDAMVDGQGTGTWGVVIIVSMVVFIASYALSIGSVAWQQSELFPQRVRGVGTSISTATNFSGTLIISATFLTMLKNITPTGTFGLFAGITFGSIIFVYFCYPELTGLELEDVQQVLADGFNVGASKKLVQERKRQAGPGRMMDLENNKPSTEMG